MKSKMLLLHLATNEKETLVNPENLAFAIRMEGENKEFTRIFFKEIVMDDESKCVDVKETPGEIRRII